MTAVRAIVPADTSLNIALLEGIAPLNSAVRQAGDLYVPKSPPQVSINPLLLQRLPACDGLHAMKDQ